MTRQNHGKHLNSFIQRAFKGQNYIDLYDCLDYSQRCDNVRFYIKIGCSNDFYKIGIWICMNSTRT